ncbi:hypothetical protein MTR_1g032280 [Medicago truncatula]|uniref:Uncharacterized protein n=1 Tax=Medicago truncatula TaxID=3880 RepID=A0A072VR40_MEDTR|nr:hypothetical protein MTR_1g032280 [Medicago truncatula]
MVLSFSIKSAVVLSLSLSRFSLSVSSLRDGFWHYAIIYAINLDVVSLFADSSFTFLAVLNDVISRFE